MNYGEILRRSLAISWHHKYIWLLALFAGEGMGLGIPNLQGQGSGRSGGSRFPAVTYDQVTTWAGAHAGLLVTIGIVIAAILIALFLVSAVASGAAVRAAAEHDLDRPFGLRPAWRSGVSTFWPVLGVKLLNLVVALAALALIGSLAVATFLAGTHGDVALAVVTGLTAGLLLLVAIPFWIVFAIAVRFALRAVVLDGKRPWAALARGFGLIRRRLGRVALVWLLVLASGAVAGLAVSVVVVIVALPLAAIAAASYLAGGIAVAIWVGVVLAVFWAVIALALVAAVAAFTSILWTLSYARLDLDPQPVPAAMPAPA